MALSLAQDAIALLIEMAERGEINPWDVNVIDVIDRFLTQLAPATGRELYEANLSQSGQAFLYASMLLLLKAESLTQVEVVAAPEEYVEEDFLDELALGQSALPANLERQLRRRAVAQPPQRRRVTLKELIDQLQLIATALEDNEPRRRSAKRTKVPRAQAIKTITQLAHQENLSEMAVAIEEFLQQYWGTVSQGADWIDFELVLEFWVELKAQGKLNMPPDPHAHAENHERVGVFWALLLLSAQSKVELAQEEFYQDLKVRSLVLSSELTQLAESALPD